MKKPPILTTVALIALTFPSHGNAILGTDLKNIASPSTCLILKPNGDDTCNGVLISPTEVQTASHCFAYLWYASESESPKVLCGFEDGVGFKFESRIDKEPLVSKSTNFERDRYSDDQMIIKLKSAAHQSAVLADPVAIQSIFSKPLAHARFGLNSAYTCKIESFLGPSKTSAYSAVIPSEHLFYDSVKKSISLEYKPIEVTHKAELDALEYAKDEKGNLSSYRSIYNLIETFHIPVLTHQGDSGSPLYCFETNNEARTKVVVGILSRGLNSTQKHSAEHTTLNLGSKWNTPIGKDQMESKRIGKKSIVQKRALNEASELEFLPL